MCAKVIIYNISNYLIGLGTSLNTMYNSQNNSHRYTKTLYHYHYSLHFPYLINTTIPHLGIMVGTFTILQGKSYYNHGILMVLFARVIFICSMILKSFLTFTTLVTDFVFLIVIYYLSDQLGIIEIHFLSFRSTPYHFKR